MQSRKLGEMLYDVTGLMLENDVDKRTTKKGERKKEKDFTEILLSYAS